ncbi:inducible metalloproteinase inhibitor protein [Tribolium madens]|uniref:inducible metalloproteinase inhibitor protein n=1 Tax=Tribolium madens TaxID=41895 RepID=UPI001CF74A1D|nr:inducible metalloproteinase inhibitor protein [Tribolium madens]
MKLYFTSFTLLISVMFLVFANNLVSGDISSIIGCNRPNEHYACGSACQTECVTLGQICPIVNIKCNDACYCNEGYARDKNGDCIPVSECKK